jgi:hypothetical protein
MTFVADLVTRAIAAAAGVAGGGTMKLYSLDDHVTCFQNSSKILFIQFIDPANYNPNKMKSIDYNISPPI